MSVSDEASDGKTMIGQPINLDAVRKKLAYEVFVSTYTDDNVVLDRKLRKCKNYDELTQSFVDTIDALVVDFGVDIATDHSVRAFWYFLVGKGLAACNQDELILSQEKRSWADLADVFVEGHRRIAALLTHPCYACSDNPFVQNADIAKRSMKQTLWQWMGEEEFVRSEDKRTGTIPP